VRYLKSYIRRNFLIYTYHLVRARVVNFRILQRPVLVVMMGRYVMHTEFLRGNILEIVHEEGMEGDRKIMLR
jgi:hypothetical protein